MTGEPTPAFRSFRAIAFLFRSRFGRDELIERARQWAPGGTLRDSNWHGDYLRWVERTNEHTVAKVRIFLELDDGRFGVDARFWTTRPEDVPVWTELERRVCDGLLPLLEATDLEPTEDWD